MADNVVLGANFSELLAAQNKVIDGFGRIEDAVLKTAKVSEGFTVGKEGQLVPKDAVANLNLVNKEGAEAALKFQQVGGAWKIINTEIRESTKALADFNAKKAERLAKEQAASEERRRRSQDAGAEFGAPDASKKRLDQESIQLEKLQAEQAANFAIQAQEKVEKAEQDRINKKRADVKAAFAEEKKQQEELIRLEEERALVSNRSLKARRLNTGRQGGRELNQLATRPQGQRTQDEIINFEKAKADLNAFIRANGVGADQVQKVWNDVANGSIKNYGTTLNRVRDGIRNLQKQQTSQGRIANKTAKEAADSIKKFNAEVQRANQIWKTLFRLQITNAVSRGVATLTANLKEATTAAKELSRSAAQISTIDVSGASLSQITEDLLTLSNLSGLDVLDVATSQYQALSNQVVSAANSFDFLLNANKLAIATLSTSTQAVNLLASTINAYGLSAGDAERISSSFFKTLELGRLRIGDISDTFGRTAVLGNQLGASLNEIQATIALFTRQGIKAANATTLLRSIMLKLIKPTTDMTNFLNDLGFESGEAAVKTLGFGGVLQAIERQATSSGNKLGELGELFSRVRAITGAAIFQGTGIQQFNRDLTLISESSGTIEEAFQKIEESSGQVVEKGINKLRNALIDGLGKDIVNLGADLQNSFGLFDKLASTIRFAGENVEIFAGIAGGLVVTKLGLMIAQTIAAAKAVAASQAVITAETVVKRANTIETLGNANARLVAAQAAQKEAASNLANIKAIGGLRGAIGRATTSLVGFISTPVGAAIAGGIAIATAAFVAFRVSAEAELKALDRRAKETADNFKKSQIDAIDEINKKLAENQLQASNILRGTIVKEAQEISKRLKDLGDQRKEIIERIKLIEEAQAIFTDQAIDAVDSRIDKTKDALKEIENEIKRVTDEIGNIDDEIRDIDLGQKLDDAITTTGKRGVLDDEIAAQKALVIDPENVEEEEERLRRIIELLKQRQGLANTRGRRQDDRTDLTAANKALRDFLIQRKADLKVDQDKKKEQIDLLEQDKLRLQNNQKIIETTLKELEALSKQSDKYDELLKKQKDFNKLIEDRNKLFQKFDVTPDVTTIQPSQTELTPEQLRELRKIQADDGNIFDAQRGAGQQGAENAFFALNEKTQLENRQVLIKANEAIGRLTREIQVLNESLKSDKSQIAQAERANDRTRLALVPEVRRAQTGITDRGGGPIGKEAQEAFARRFAAEQAREARERKARESAQDALRDGFTILKRLRLAIESGDVGRLQRVQGLASRGQDLAKIITELVKNAEKRGKLTADDLAETKALVKVLDNVAQIAQKQLGEIQGRNKLAELETKRAEEFARRNLEAPEKQAAKDAQRERAEQQLAPLLKAIQESDTAVNKLGVTFKEEINKQGAIDQANRNVATQAFKEAQAAAGTQVTNAVNAAKDDNAKQAQLMITQLSDIGRKIANAVNNPSSIEIGGITVNMPQNTNLTEKQVTDAVIKALPRAQRLQKQQ